MEEIISWGSIHKQIKTDNKGMLRVEEIVFSRMKLLVGYSMPIGQPPNHIHTSKGTKQVVFILIVSVCECVCV